MKMKNQLRAFESRVDLLGNYFGRISPPANNSHIAVYKTERKMTAYAKQRLSEVCQITSSEIIQGDPGNYKYQHEFLIPANA